MRTHTDTEKNEARSRVPKAIVEFLDSPDLKLTYETIGKELGLNLRHMLAVTKLGNAILLGLEPESLLRSELAVSLGDLEESRREALADALDKQVFTEARNRLKKEKH